MAMQRIEDMSLLDMEATFGDYFESIPNQKEPLVEGLVSFEEFAQNSTFQGGLRRGEINIICAGGRTR